MIISLPKTKFLHQRVLSLRTFLFISIIMSSILSDIPLKWFILSTYLLSIPFRDSFSLPLQYTTEIQNLTLSIFMACCHLWQYVLSKGFLAPSTLGVHLGAARDRGPLSYCGSHLWGRNLGYFITLVRRVGEWVSATHCGNILCSWRFTVDHTLLCHHI